MSRLWIAPVDNPLKERMVLIAVQSPWVEPVVKAILQVGGSPLAVKTVEEVFPVLQFGQPEFYILSEGFSTDQSQQNSLLEFIQNMPTNQRRDIFVVWISGGVTSGDILSAFSYSVNLVLQPENLEDIVYHLKKSWTLWQDLYQVFIQTRSQITG